MSRLLVLVAFVLAAVGIADRTVPLWAGPTSVSAPSVWRVRPSTVPAALIRAAAVPVRLVRAPAGPVFRWPLEGVPTVTRGFAPPPEPWLPGHRGVDLAGSPGEAVLAAGAGVVAFAGKVAGLGVVSVDHPDGLRTTYEPVLAKVHVGQSVDRGAQLGTLLPDHPGCPVDACLHWGLRSGDTYLDPLSLLQLARVRLLPLDGVIHD